MLRSVLVAAMALGAGAIVSVPGVAMADGVERPRAPRAAPRPAPRRPQAARPAPAPMPAPIPAPAPVEMGPEKVTLNDSFFHGPLTGGVGYSYGAGASGGGGGGFVVIAGGAGGGVYSPSGLAGFGRVMGGCGGCGKR